MKKILSTLFALLILILCLTPASAEIIKNAKITSEQQIGDLKSITDTSGSMYITDNNYNIIAGPYKSISDMSGYCLVLDDGNGNTILFDKDGSVIATAPQGYDIQAPANGIYTITKQSDADSVDFTVYDYETKAELMRANGIFLYYLEQVPDRMFIKSNGKYAVIDNKCTFITDYIYDDVIKRFNPDYDPFPKSYAIVVQDGVLKYIDRDLNEIDLDNYNGEVFITDSSRISGLNFEPYKNFYVIKSGDRSALYNMDTGTFLIPYQSEYAFIQMSDKYILIEKGGECAVMDHAGNIVVPYSNANYSLLPDGQVAYHYFDGEATREGIIDPESGEKQEAQLGDSGYFYKVLGADSKEDIAYGTIVSNGKAADIKSEDLKKFLDIYWNFGYERVISPINETIGDTYIKLWNADRSKSHIIYNDSSVILGSFGYPTDSHGETKANYVCYMPLPGNGRNALYTAFETVRHTYFNESYKGFIEARRDITEADKIEIPADNLLPTNSASEWAVSEIERAAACNLLIFELTDKYRDDITRQEFCRLGQRLIVTEFYPYADSRMGVSVISEKIAAERNLDIYSVVFSDCTDSAVNFMAAAGIVEGMGDGTFAPKAPITREEAAAILYRMAVFLGNKTMPDIESATPDYHDSGNISDWAVDAVAALNLMDIMEGDADGSFYPKNNYTVEQAIATMLRLYECY